MLKGLTTPQKFDLRTYALGKLAKDIDTAFCEHFNTDTVYYYIESCPERQREHRDSNGVCHHTLVWYGPKLTLFVDKVQQLCARKKNAPVLFVTDLNSKNKVVDLRTTRMRLWEEEDRWYNLMFTQGRVAFFNSKEKENYARIKAEKDRVYKLIDEHDEAENKHEYWIGDVSRDGKMICCDDLWVQYWNLKGQR